MYGHLTDRSSMKIKQFIIGLLATALISISAYGQYGVSTLYNRAGSSVSKYDVVIWDTSNSNSFKTTTTSRDTKVIGVVNAASISNNATGQIVQPGAIIKVRVTGAVTRGDYLVTSTTAGAAASGGTVNSSGAFAIALETGTSTNITAYLISPSQSSSSGSISIGSISLPDGHTTIIQGTDSDIQYGYDEATDDRWEMNDGTNTLIYVKDLGTTGLLGTTGRAELPQIGISTDTDLLTLTADALALAGVLNGTLNNSGTNDVATLIAAYHTSTGTPASGLGASISLGAENSAGTAKAATEIQGYLSTVTNASEQGVLLVRLMNAGSLQDVFSVTTGTNTASLVAARTTLNLFNTVATTVNAFGAATAFNVAADTDLVAQIGRTRLASPTTDRAHFSHVDMTGGTQYAILQLAGGQTHVNSAAGNSLLLQIAATSIIAMTSTSITMNQPITMADATNFLFNTTTGTKLGTATTQKLGFWNSTPIVQPSSTGEATGYTGAGGTALTHTDTFTGNTGTKAYTINDIVKHLKTVGLLASS